MKQQAKGHHTQQSTQHAQNNTKQFFTQQEAIPDLTRLSPKTVLQLQRHVGNKTTSNLIQQHQTPQTAIQRMAYIESDKGFQPTLYVPTAWANKTITYNQQEQTIQNILHSNQQDNFIQTLNQTLGLTIQRIIVTDDVADLQLTHNKSKKQRQAIAAMKEALIDPQKLVHLESNQDPNPYDIFNAPLTYNVQDMIPEADDLGQALDYPKACALISIVRSEGIPAIATWLEQKGLKYKPTNGNIQTVVGKMHDYYYVDNNVMYDDTSTHIGLYGGWGFNLIFSGNVTWRQLLEQRVLQLGQSYIFDLAGHSVYGTLTEAVPDEFDQDARPSDYVTLQSDPDNYNLNEFDEHVHYVYTK